MDFAEKMQRCHDYVQGLEEERRKIQVFHRELPLCLQLVCQAIEACRQQLSENVHGGQSECSEQTMTTDGPVLEEFIPMNRSNSSCDDDDEEHQSLELDENSKDKNNNDKKKSDWLSSVQLWNQTPDPSPEEDFSKRASVTEVKRNGGAFQPFHREEKSVGKTNTSVGNVPSSAPATATSCTAEPVSGGGSSKKEEKERQAQRKERRCWSPELHRRFLHALQQLGGSHAATPKQIREHMKVDGLTNDEVKSHLQKYRLHTRRPSPTIHNNANAQAPQFVVVGGIWVPPEYAVAATTVPGDAGSAAGAAAANGIYAPVAAPPPTVSQASASLMQRLQQKEPELSHSEEERGSHSEGGGVHSNSPASSSSTHTTASRGF